MTEEADKLPLDNPRRAELYQQAQELLVYEAPVAFFWYSAGPYLRKPWVTGVKDTPLDYFPGIFDIASIEIVTE